MGAPGSPGRALRLAAALGTFGIAAALLWAACSDSPGVTPGPELLFDCTQKADGTDCSPSGTANFICFGGMCLASRCGDGLVHAPSGEDCDDGNDNPDDGCNECRYGCTVSDGGDTCVDGNSCNGVEACNTTTHVCTAGTPVADGSPCVQGDGQSGLCHGGTCASPQCGDGLPTKGEECDDGNAKDGDGCDNDCTYSCSKSEECSDANACNGVETCDTTAHRCRSGPPPNCDDGKPCTADSCDPAKGCLHTPVDQDKDGHAATPCGDDCNDHDPAIFKGAPECKDAKDNDCNGVVDDNTVPAGCWQDPDKDGYAGTTASKLDTCICPTGYTRRNPATAGHADCAPAVASANPAQTGFFTSPFCAAHGAGGACTSHSWDYNCSGQIEKQSAAIAPSTGCTLKSGTCVGTGWLGVTVPPDCGVQAKRQSCTKNASGSCVSSVVTLTQGCH